MKRLVFAAGFPAFLLTSQAGWAKTLEEVLKERGVITEADLEEVTTAPRPAADQLGKGFTFTSRDKRFGLSLGGRGQFQFMYVDKDDVNGPAQDTSVWRIRRFKVYMGGYAFLPDLTYRVRVDLAKSGTAQMLDDAWINYRFIDEAQLQAGQFKIPFARQELTSDGALQFVDRANAGTSGWLGKAAANTAIFDNTERVDVGMCGFDAAFKWRGLSVQGEYFGGKADGKTNGTTVHSRGYYAQAGYFLLPKRLEVAARYSSVDPNRDRSRDLQVELNGGVSYYFRGHNLKLQGDYTNIHIQQAVGKQPTDDKQMRVQAQLAF